jgi:hypothetical protein
MFYRLALLTAAPNILLSQAVEQVAVLPQTARVAVVVLEA